MNQNQEYTIYTEYNSAGYEWYLNNADPSKAVDIALNLINLNKLK